MDVKLLELPRWGHHEYSLARSAVAKLAPTARRLADEGHQTNFTLLVANVLADYARCYVFPVLFAAEVQRAFEGSESATAKEVADLFEDFHSGGKMRALHEYEELAWTVAEYVNSFRQAQRKASR